jgi:hypothetical protein
MPAKKVNSLNLATFSAFLIKSAQLVAALKRGKPGPQGPSPFGSGVFKYPKKRKPGKRASQVVATPGLNAPGPVVVNPTPPPTGQGGTAPPAVRTLLWEKRNLSASAAQIVPAGTQIKGHITLGRAKFSLPNGAPINPTTYFRNTVFGRLAWMLGTPETAVGSFRVEIMGVNLGVNRLKLTHDLGRIAGQNNVPTWLHWGDLNTYLKGHSVIGKTLRLYSAMPSDGVDFFLEIA